ncbi:acyl carrier protein [Streptosporangium sp. NPDC005286]|uniref:acyl carrier protein n=1 Tax=Streptosporangium sp. NPDC005286 TaxID=3154463 RepID=UPI0033B46CC8
MSGNITNRDAGEIEEWLIRRVADHVGARAQDIDSRSPLADLGLSSADAVAMSGDLEKRYDVPVQATLLWEHPTIRAIAEHLAEHSAAPDGVWSGPSATAFDLLLRETEETVWEHEQTGRAFERVDDV